MLAVVFAVGMSTSAWAEVDVTADIFKFKTVLETETINVNKEYDIKVLQTEQVDNSAESQVIKNDSNTGNAVYDEADELTATIDGGSFDGSVGIVGVNQSPGYINNQGNATSIAVAAEGDAFVHAEAAVDALNAFNLLEHDPGAANRTNLIDTSFVGVSGVVGVNQATGSMNNQNNATAFSLGVDAAAGLAQTDLGLFNGAEFNSSSEALVQIGGGNQIVVDLSENNTDTLTAAFAGSSGVVGVNQSTGSLNNQVNAVSIAATVPNAWVAGPPTPGL
jgi:hypothetical protein